MSPRINKLNVVFASILFVVWLAVHLVYNAPEAPLSKVEIDRYMKGVERMLQTNFVMPQGAGLDPDGLAGAMEDLRQFAERDDGEPVYMVNIMKWRSGEIAFPAGKELDFIKTAQDADKEYNRRLFWDLLRNNSYTAFLGSAERNAFNYGATEELNNWGEIGVFRYSSRRDFFNMITSENYVENSLFLKLVSMGVVVVTPTKVHGMGLNPNPNISARVGVLFVIGFLLFLLFRKQP